MRSDTRRYICVLKRLTAQKQGKNMDMYVSGTDIYRHMPIDPTSTRRAIFYERPLRPIFGFWGSKVHKKFVIPALDVDEPTCKI